MVSTLKKNLRLNRFFSKIPVLIAKKPVTIEALENAQKPDNRVLCSGIRRQPAAAMA